VISAASSDARYKASAASFRGDTHWERSAPGSERRLAGVSMVPGRITLAVIPSLRFSSAAVFTSEIRAAFEAL
jgi:hypothetical protein